MSYGTVQAEKMTTESGYSLGAGNSSSFKNRIINGNMDINQRAFSGDAVEFGYTLDRWITFIGTSATWSVSQNAGSVTPPSGFTDYLGATSLAATTPSASQRNLVCQMIEGYNIADWAWGYPSAKPITLSFWVRSSLTGTFGAAINSTAQVVSATFSYTINAANTWEYKTITVQGPTTNPAYWDTTNGRGLWLFFDMGTGANFALDTTWGSSAKYTIGSSRTNVIGTNGATWYLTGVQIEVGTVATSFDYRPFGTELALCQRYCYVWSAANANSAIAGSGQAFGSSSAYILMKTPMTMRVPPVTFSSTGNFGSNNASGGGLAVTGLSLVSSWTNENMITLQPSVSSGWAAGNAVLMGAGADTSCRLTFSAEL
jgi:hypothetical protein